MPPALASLARIPAAFAVADRHRLSLATAVLLHAAALGILVWSEYDLVGQAAFLLAWGLFNFLWLMLLPRPVIAAALSLVLVVVLVLLSRLKYQTLFMTVSFVDVMIVDSNSIRFLLAIFPSLTKILAVVVPPTLLLLVLFWWFDPLRIRRKISAAGCAVCISGLGGIGYLHPIDPVDSFYGGNFLSSFARSGVDAIPAFVQHGYMESDAATPDRLKTADETTCAPAHKPPHVIVVHDESSFDIRMAPGIKVPDGYGAHFRSFDGKARRFLVEGAGGPSWYTEFSVFTGLSARSFGRFSYFVTRIAAGRIKRGLPYALRRCGYRTYSLYPWLGAFMGTRNFQTSVGVERFRDMAALGTRDLEPDAFFYEATRRIIDRERSNGPLFIFTYLAANHFPWTFRYRPDLLPDWRDPGNAPNVDEYLRRQKLSADDYAAFLARLKRDYPNERFLIVRFGDHQPDFAANLLAPGLPDAEVARQIAAYERRYYTTYYAVDTVNYSPPDLSLVLDAIDAPYLPLLVQELAGLPLDPSFAEQKKIFKRCDGVFYACEGGAEARRFNRLLIDAGLIKRL